MSRKQHHQPTKRAELMMDLCIPDLFWEVETAIFLTNILLHLFLKTREKKESVI